MSTKIERRQSDTHRDTVSKAINARNEAVRVIIENHREEYESIHGDIRVSVGLPRQPNGVLTPRQKLEAKLKRATEKAQQIREELMRLEDEEL